MPVTFRFTTPSKKINIKKIITFACYMKRCATSVSDQPVMKRS